MRKSMATLITGLSLTERCLIRLHPTLFPGHRRRYDTRGGEVRMRTHIAFPVRDLSASRAFYEIFLGQRVFRTQPGYAQFLTEHLNLALTETREAAPSAGHFGIEVRSPEDVDTSLARV